MEKSSVGETMKMVSAVLAESHSKL